MGSNRKLFLKSALGALLQNHKELNLLLFSVTFNIKFCKSNSSSCIGKTNILSVREWERDQIQWKFHFFQTQKLRFICRVKAFLLNTQCLFLISASMRISFLSSRHMMAKRHLNPSSLLKQLCYTYTSTCPSPNEGRDPLKGVYTGVQITKFPLKSLYQHWRLSIMLDARSLNFYIYHDTCHYLIWQFIK